MKNNFFFIKLFVAKNIIEYEKDKAVVNAIISWVNSQYSRFVELLGVLTMVFLQKRLLGKRFLLEVLAGFRRPSTEISTSFS